MSSILTVNRNNGKQYAQLIFYSVLFFLSGGAGLIYEIVWERLLAIYFGVTMTSITLIISAYMAGLGLGSLYGGRITKKTKSYLFTYGILEITIGLFGLISPLLITWIGQATAGSPSWLVFLISFAVLIIPTFLMGMTLPLLTQAFIKQIEFSGQVIGILYGINTLGAALGSGLAAYILIGKFGFSGTTNIAAAVNVGVGLLALIASRSSINISSVTNHSTSTTPISSWKYKQILLASFLVGFIGLGFEMLWIRVLHIINKNTSYGFASILLIFLIGLSLGSYYWGRRADRSRDLNKLFWQVEIAAGIIASLGLIFFWFSLQNNIVFPGFSDFWSMQKPISPFVRVNNAFVFSGRQALNSLLNYFQPILIIVLPASFMLGGGLPLLDRLAINSPDGVGQKVGDIHLANIIGSVFGSILISFLMLPILGSESTHKVLVVLGMIFPIIYFIDQPKRIKPDLISGSMILASLALLVFLPGKGEFYKSIYATATRSDAIIHESSDGVLSLTMNESGEPAWLWIGGETNSFYPSDGTFEARGILCAGASQPKRILVIGMGGAVTTRFFQTIPGANEIIVVELMDDLGNFLDQNVPFISPVFHDPHINYVVDDGRRYLYANPNEKFDMIFIDPLRWYSSGHNNMYSLEAMQLYKSHLTEHGVFCAYADEQHAIPNTIAHAFPFVDQFRFRLVVSSKQQIQYDFAYMQSITQNYLETTQGMLKPGTDSILQPLLLIDNYSRDRDQIISDEKKTSILTDMQPSMEYYFFNTPIKRPIWLKGDIQKILIPRISNCGLCGEIE